MDTKNDKNSLSSSPLSSGLYSLSSSLNSSITSNTGSSTLFTTTNYESDSYLSRSSSIASLQTPDPIKPKTENNVVQQRKIDWNLLNNSETYLNQVSQQENDLKWISKFNNEFTWNLNRLTEISMANSYNIQSSNSKMNSNLAQPMNQPRKAPVGGIPARCTMNNNNQGNNYLSKPMSCHTVVDPYYSGNCIQKSYMLVNNVNNNGHYSTHMNRGLVKQSNDRVFSQRCQ